MSRYTKDPLFTAILENDFEEIKRLKSQGVSLSDEVKNRLSINRLNTPACEDAGWIDYDYLCAVRLVPAEKFIKTIRALREEMGAPLFFFPAFWGDIKFIMFKDGVWECVLECLEHKMNKSQAMREIIKADRADMLALCAEHGWLKAPKKRDEMIKYASENNKTECTALLLDFKNRTADLAAERAKAEKKAERELNAAPDSVTALKQIWSYKKQADGVIITGYKGRSTEVAVPERIGKDTVTAIGDSAFCPFAPRVTPEIKDARKAITKITLPGTVNSVGRAAFWACENLRSINIPDGVKVINENTFAECAALEEIAIPSTVKCIEKRAFFKCGKLKFIEVPEGVELINEAAFAMCKELTALVLPSSLKYISSLNIVTGSDKFIGAVVPRGSYAEEFCKKHNIPFKFKISRLAKADNSRAEEYCKARGIPFIYNNHKEDKG